MDMLGLALAGALAATAIGVLLLLVWGGLNIPRVSDAPSTRLEGAPRVSVVVAARDEERHLEPALHAWLALDYPDYELIVVDDRSTDRTPEILEVIGARDPRLHVARIDRLPDGWLGKNHALHVGAQAASGALLLFTDADVILEPDALSRAVRLLRAERAEHLAVAPDMVAPTWPLALTVNYFMMWFLLWLRPWRARDAASPAFIGIGAFNLVDAAAYRAAGGHAAIALRPDDDIMLGKLLKRRGRRQLLASGAGLLRVEWYRTLPEMERGLRKNTFAGLRYSVPLSVAALAGNLLLGVWPFVAVWMTSGAERSLYATAALTLMLAYAGPAIAQRSRPWLALLYPVAALTFGWIMASGVLRTLARGGIEWRGTFYPLAALRSNRI